MKKLSLVLILSSVTATAANADLNPYFGTTQNQIAINIGQGVNSGFLVPPPSQFVPFYMLPNIQYSQPTTFFSMPARQSLNFGETVGMGRAYGWDWTDFSIPMVWASGDVALLYGCDWYVGPGVGVGFQAKENDRLGAKLVFQFKISAGYHFTENWGGEIFVQHFSNGNTAEENHSYAFYGLGVTYNF
ncbi:acyloxyacyl hydrolase [bacterium]|nr:acyloxyacyl hydrolase [bacterium]